MICHVKKRFFLFREDKKKICWARGIIPPKCSMVGHLQKNVVLHAMSLLIELNKENHKFMF